MLYVASALAIGVLVGSLNLPHYSRLEAHGADTKARVTATDCGNRGTVVYEFRVGDRTYAGRGNPGSTNPSCDRLTPGTTISVRYLLTDPGQSLPGDINDRLQSEWLSVVVAAFGMPLIVLFFARRQLRRWGGAPSS